MGPNKTWLCYKYWVTEEQKIEYFKPHQSCQDTDNDK